MKSREERARRAVLALIVAGATLFVAQAAAVYLVYVGQWAAG